MDKNYRIHTNISSDTILNVNMQQDYDFLEVLTLKLRQKDAYKLHSSNYGVIIGRVLANDAFGIPNAKISVFIERDSNDTSVLEAIYPYSEVTTKDRDGRRYNLLPDDSDDDCYRIVGTFPNKRLVLDDNTELAVYDKYWKYTTVTNNAGDYMLFGIPSGNQQLHVDIDLSDIGILSQKPRDFEYKGYNVTMFDNPSQFKESTNLESLAQIFSQNKSVFVYPFWGDADNGIAAITRADIEIQYKFEPTCVFMGSIVSDNEGNAIGHKCAPAVDNGMNEQLVAGEGTIEMIRKTTDGLIEEYQIQGNQLIDSDGVWCYQIPMNLDYVGTDEYGNIVPTDNPSKGIPTRTQVRFRFSKNETGDEGFSRHTAKYLVPMNPPLMEGKGDVVPKSLLSGQDFEKLYSFGSNTPESCFRDLYWNNVYSVKNYIPKVQVAHRPYSKNYTALKGSNLVENQNPIPFNKLRIDIPFMYMIVCILFTVVMWVVAIINLIICGINKIFSILNILHNLKILWVRPFGWIPAIPYIGCISLGGGLTEDNTAFYPGCECSEGLNASDCPDDMEGNCIKRASKGELLDRVQQRLAEDYKIVKLDLYQDWVNGCLYMPLWYWRKRKKKTFLFFTLSSAKNEYCSCDSLYTRLKTYVTCNFIYRNNGFGLNENDVPERENNWHRNTDRAGQVRYRRGVIKEVENKDGLKVYYYTALQSRDMGDGKESLEMDKLASGFHAVRLYATDIILLGNLNEENLYGIPQFFKVLPSTTANIPPIATIYEQIESDNTQGKYVQNEVAGGEDSGTSITTGMDWKRDGDEDEPNYKGGLFMDLACVYAHTKAKSCINVERLSELGVSLDMTHKMSYSHNGNGIQTGMLDSDGFISKYELDDMENRAMFATMNHIGFVPQSYQDRISGYTTQVEDSNTNYLVPKFKYIYPVDFDGRMQVLMERYANGFKQSLYDELDDAYVTFRMGATSNGEEQGRTRHFYYPVQGNNNFEMPLYNNSFFFYFGIRKGSTAIDKFNKLFYAECFKNDKKPFAYDLSVKGRSYCPSLYENNEGYGYIRVSSDDIRTPFSYALYDSNGVQIIKEGNMFDTDFVIGGKLDENGGITNNENGSVRYHITDEAVGNEYGASGLTNQTYTLVITDADGRRLSDRVKLDMNKITFEYEGRKLGTKYYNTENSRIDYICNSENEYYGVIEVTKFYVDTYEYKIVDARVLTRPNVSGITIDGDKYTISVTGERANDTDPISRNVNVIFELYTLYNDSSTSGTPSVKDCMCDSGNSIPFNSGITVNYFEFIGEKNLFKFNVYQPVSFVGKMILNCDGMASSENFSSEIIKIPNGENFNTFLNNMPTRFILGTTTDGKDADIANTSNFYRSEVVTNPTYDGLNGWFGVHQEDTYQFKLPINQPIPRNKGIWADFLTIGTDITNIDVRKNILRYKFDRMFKLSDVTYLTSSNNKTHRYTAVGGVEPILYRSVTPYYSKYNMLLTNFSYSDKNYATYSEEYPHVVGVNYHEEGSRGPVPLGENNDVRFNELYKESNRNQLGDYFAAFTKNGRYTATTAVDCDISIAALPNYAAVNVDGGVKRLGRERQLSEIPNGTYEVSSDCGRNTQPYLRALNIDRRLDFDFIVIAPAMNKNIRLHQELERERPWKCGRISGWTYGGIEMSYDEDYNIISATTPTTPQEWKTWDGSQEANKRLEYSYHVTSGETDEAKTIYNEPKNGEVVWVNRTDTSAWKLYDEEYDADDSKQYIKTLYEATINDIDIRQLFWSTFNYERLNAYRGVQPSFYSTLDKSDFYVFQHANEGFNGDFNRSTANDYPTRRLLDIGNIAPSDEYYFNLTSCSYGMSPIVREDGVIECYAEPGEIAEFTLQFINPIEFIPPNADNKDYANAVMKLNGSDGEYKKFAIEAVDLSFRLNKIASYDFDVYTTPPRIVKILSDDILRLTKNTLGESMDGLTYIKTSENDLTERLDNILIYQLNMGNTYLAGDLYIDCDRHPYFTWDLSHHELIPYFSRNDEYVTSDDNDFYNTWYQIRVGEDERLNTDVYVIALLVLRRYKASGSGHLIRRISSIECSNMYDVRHVLLKPYIDKEWSYIATNISSAKTDVNITELGLNTELTLDGAQTSCGETVTGTIGGDVTYEEGSGKGSGDTETETLYQVVSFQMYVDTTLDPKDMQNQSFADYDMMGFTFKFTNRRNESHYLTPEVSLDDNSEIDSNGRLVKGNINFKMVFTPEMSVLADNRLWYNNEVPVTMFAKTSDNFTYSIPFYLKVGEQGNYDYDNHRSKDLGDKKAVTPIVIKT